MKMQEDDAEKGHDPLRVKEMDFCLREQNEVENWADEITNLCRQWRYGVAVDIYVEAKVARSKATRRYGDMHFEAKLYHPDHKNGKPTARPKRTYALHELVRRRRKHVEWRD